jgi:ubiquinone biosynthesis protein
MFKSIFQLFRIARKLASSGAVDTVNEIYSVPLVIKLFFDLLSIGSKKKLINRSKNPGEKLCDALEGMGTTFIKLGQFLATRPDIIGENLANNLVKLQDKLPPFELHESKKILKKEIGENLYQNIVSLSEPIAAASIAQVHIAKINIDNDECVNAICLHCREFIFKNKKT